MKISNTIFILQSISQHIEVWNEKLNSLIGKYGDNPFFGTMIFFALGIVIFSLVAMFAKK